MANLISTHWYTLTDDKDLDDVLPRISAALMKMGEKGAAAVAALLGDENWDVRFVAADLLSGMGESGLAYKKEVAALLKPNDRRVKETAEKLLKFGVAGWKETLALLKDPIWDVKLAAAEAIGYMRQLGMETSEHSKEVADLLRSAQG